MRVLCVIVCFMIFATNRQYCSNSQSYCVTYPRGWHLDIAEDGVFILDSFPRSQATRGSHIPDGEAEVIVMPAEALDQKRRPLDAQGWADMENKSYSTVIDSRHVTIRVGAGTVVALEVRARSGAVAPFSESVMRYFKLNDRLFKSGVIYWAESARSTDFISAMDSVTSSLVSRR